MSLRLDFRQGEYDDQMNKVKDKNKVYERGWELERLRDTDKIKRNKGIVCICMCMFVWMGVDK